MAKLSGIVSATTLVLVAAVGSSPARAEGPAAAEVTACFSPGPRSCAEVIADAIDASRTTVLVQAYWLTSVPILRSLVRAKRRGVDVQAVLDRTQDRRSDPRGRYSGAVYLAHAGIPVWIDDAASIAHNKVLILDGTSVVTGSFNFTTSADTRNAENVVIIRSPEVAGWYARNWEARRAMARIFEVE